MDLIANVNLKRISAIYKTLIILKDTIQKCILFLEMEAHY